MPPPRCAGDECSVESIDAAAVGRAAAVVPDDVRLKTMSDIFSALADPTRLRILTALTAGELCVCDLAEVTGVSASAVSHQLRVLRDRDLVTFTRVGRQAIYRLSDEHVASLLEQGSEHAGEHR